MTSTPLILTLTVLTAAILGLLILWVFISYTKDRRARHTRTHLHTQSPLQLDQQATCAAENYESRVHLHCTYQPSGTPHGAGHDGRVELQHVKDLRRGNEREGDGEADKAEVWLKRGASRDDLRKVSEEENGSLGTRTVRVWGREGDVGVWDMTGGRPKGFDRDDTVAAVRDYYHFLAKMYLAEDRIMEPPPGGWPNITPETMRPLEKTDEFKLCRTGRLLFSRNTQISSVLVCTDGDDGGGEVWAGGVPPYCVGLTIAARDDVICFWTPFEAASGGWSVPTRLLEDDGFGIELDDEQTSDKEDNESRTSGEESLPTSDDEAQGGSDDQVDDDEEQLGEEEEDLGPEWIQGFWFPQWGIPEFFEKMKKHYRQLDFVPRNSKEVLEGWPRDSKEPMLVGLLKPIYRKHGWPNLEQYRKEECMKEIEEALRKAGSGRYSYESDS
ncbi:hypothetical protein BU25DRAFT_467792 [Macroventuria anomochaeta]|uniref:Uncharacterized protein n=1 Tax=Macroventuria anomochaeta TaxID=301207 RepID=A0ACB6S3K2_9PLEO|nr:uncharacterized protein BU25DRAFT_467792 [Macroventuria anomochaeta]KAF2627774.1 hypothetical protein BU25DRAFT_467792 [Macroventuria anomochaeta]